MNLARLKQLEADFLYQYPGGFDNPKMIETRKKHKLDKMIEMAQEAFVKRNFKLPDLIVENTVKIITRSSLISVFEKPKFRDYAYSLAPEGRKQLAEGLEGIPHGNQQRGFEKVADVLQRGKLAKWPLMTVCPAYFHPQVEVFVKPTITKQVIEYLQLTDLHYHPRPTWAFYNEYRAAINEMKSHVEESLARYNIGFTGFLMRTMPGQFS
jgi:hypothetical protein